MKINNIAKLPYKVIGDLIDQCMKEYQGETFYIGKVSIFRFEYKNKLYRGRIRYLKTFTEWTIEEVEYE